MAPLTLRRREPRVHVDSRRDDLGPALFSTALVTVGRWRCPVECAVFADSGPARGHLFVFPRTSVWIEHEGGRRFVADPTVVTFYNAGQRYRRYALHPAGDHGEWFAVAPSVLRDVLGRRDPALADREAPRFPFTHGPSDRPGYAAQRAVYAHVCETPVPDALFVEETLLGVLDRAVAAALTQQAGPRTSSARERDLAEAARSVLARGFAGGESLHAIASHVGCSAFHLARVFRRVTGRSLHGYRTELRLRAALDRLASPSTDLLDLALALGFSSHSHFTSAFRAAFGLTPSDVRGRLTGGRTRELIARICMPRHSAGA